MSTSARRSSEENILAMLERDSAERGSSSRMAWYGAGSALALVLVGALGWLAWDNGVLHDDELLTPVAVAAPAPAPIVASATAPRPPAIQPARAATIVEVAPETGRTPQAEAPQPKADPAPLVLLSAGEVAARQRAAAVEAPAARPRKAKLARVAAPARTKKHAAAKAKPAKARPHARPARRTPPAASSRSAKMQPLDVRTKKQAPLAEAPADGDVALISAILSHPQPHPAAPPSGPRLAPQP